MLAVLIAACDTAPAASALADETFVDDVVAPRASETNPPRAPAELLGNYDDENGDGHACLSVRENGVTYASLSFDSERGCGVDLVLERVDATSLTLRERDARSVLVVEADALRFDRGSQPMCAHLDPSQFTFRRASRRPVRDCFE
ncbi:MAG: hypothetical protein H6721_20655 [Sandaracinus sp.]|nr:hypothetical protein [Sandaracinus sp.]MCB9634542.1 hypothetical protein [Sandaracinus sp.]